MSDLLEISSLSVSYGPAVVVDGVSLSVGPGEIVGLVGESGCGKTSLGLAILGLLPETAQTSGSIQFEGVSLLSLGVRERRKLLGTRLGLIPQAAISSLDPLYTIRRQMGEAIRAHDRHISRHEADTVAIGALRDVGVADAERRLRSFPHELSGGTRQRVAIAIAMSLRPTLLIADEPTSSLDVTIQAQVLRLLLQLTTETGTAVLFVTHDLAVVANLCSRVAVMYAGEIVEEGRTDDLFEDPRHPYTKKLVAAHPGRRGRGQSLESLPGSVPDPSHKPPGCRFSPRCPEVEAVCYDARPPFVTQGDGRLVRCVHSVR